jgi:hypothetical protein
MTAPRGPEDLAGTDIVPPRTHSLLTVEARSPAEEKTNMLSADRTPHEAAKLLTTLSLQPGLAATLGESHLSLQLAYERWVAGAEAGMPDNPRGFHRRTRRGELRRRVAEVQFAVRVAIAEEGGPEEDPRQLRLPLPVAALDTTRRELAA